MNTVKRLGFLLADVPTEVDRELEPDLEAVLDQPVIDWEALPITQRVAVATGRRDRVPVGC